MTLKRKSISFHPIILSVYQIIINVDSYYVVLIVCERLVHELSGIGNHKPNCER